MPRLRITKLSRSEYMAGIKSKDTKIELQLQRELWRRGHRYRKNVSSVCGKADVVIKRSKSQFLVSMSSGAAGVARTFRPVEKPQNVLREAPVDELIKYR